jgi:hypothetical protein
MHMAKFRGNVWYIVYDKDILVSKCFLPIRYKKFKHVPIFNKYFTYTQTVYQSDWFMQINMIPKKMAPVHTWGARIKRDLWRDL